MNETITDLDAIDYGMLPGLLGYQLRRAQLLVFQSFSRHLQERQVTPTQFAVLVLIGNNPGLTQRVLSEAVGTDQSTLVSLLDRLEARDWIARQRSPQDRRYHVLSLTDAGTQALTVLTDLVKEQDDALSAMLTPAERAQLMGLLARLTS